MSSLLCGDCRLSPVRAQRHRASRVALPTGIATRVVGRVAFLVRLEWTCVTNEISVMVRRLGAVSASALDLAAVALADLGVTGGEISGVGLLGAGDGLLGGQRGSGDSV